MHKKADHSKLLATLFGCAFLAIALTLAAPASSVEVGDTPPDNLGYTEGGEDVLLSESVGRIRVVSFWATWCSPCLKELPVLNSIQKAGGAQRIQVIAINLKESSKQFRKAMRAYEDYEITFIHDRRGTVAKRFDVDAIPHMLIIDVDGRVAFRHVGYREEAIGDIVADINSLLVKNNLVE